LYEASLTGFWIWVLYGGTQIHTHCSLQACISPKPLPSYPGFSPLLSPILQCMPGAMLTASLPYSSILCLQHLYYFPPVSSYTSTNKIIFQGHAGYPGHVYYWFASYLFRTCFLLGLFLTVNMEATCSSETSVHFQRTTWRFIPKDWVLHNHHCKNLKSYTTVCYNKHKLPIL
jgi:hypothetical protein